MKWKKVIVDKIRSILHVEKCWLANVKIEFNFQKKENMINAWRLYVKYCKAKRGRRLN